GGKGVRCPHGNPLEPGACRRDGRPKTEDRNRSVARLLAVAATLPNSEGNMRRLFVPLLLLAAAAPTAGAQSSPPSAPPAPRVRTFSSYRTDDSDRAMLGIATGSSGRRDT